MPKYTPILPKAVAIKKSLPSEMRRAPVRLERILSYDMIKNASKFISIMRQTVKLNEKAIVRLICYVVDG